MWRMDRIGAVAVADTFYAAAAVCRAGSLLFGPYAPDSTWWVENTQTVVLPEPEELARLLDRPQWSRWWQPTLLPIPIGGGS